MPHTSAAEIRGIYYVCVWFFLVIFSRLYTLTWVLVLESLSAWVGCAGGRPCDDHSLAEHTPEDNLQCSHIDANCDNQTSH